MVIDMAKRKRPSYKKGFNILMDYWDFIPEDERHNVDKKLKKVGL